MMAAGPGMMMRMMFALMDTDNDGAISLSEFQAAHERIFRTLDANKDGRLTFDEVQAMMRGRAETAQPGGTPPERRTPE
jgi:Ca2+-binding EF-hand superfamily protein